MSRGHCKRETGKNGLPGALWAHMDAGVEAWLAELCGAAGVPVPAFERNESTMAQLRALAEQVRTAAP